MKFTDLNLEPALQSNLDKLNFESCTPVQEQCIPLLLEGKDVSGLAQTGTGKTAAFLVPMIDRILKAMAQAKAETQGLTPDQLEAAQALMARKFHDWKAQNFILILVPTRELAEQVGENCQKMLVDTPLKSCVVYGGTSYDKQKEAFRQGVEFVIATPGRLIDLYKEHVVDLKQVRAIVFDEADRMFDMGFKDDMKFILSRMPRQRQFCVFSATMNFDVLNTAYQFGAEPVEINISRDQAKADNVKDEIFHVGSDEKAMYLLSILKKHNPKQTIVFSNFKHNVERIAQFLTKNGMPAMGISSLLTQAQRNRVMEQFKAENDSNILVATDVAARGLDIKGVDMVVNFELPNDPESYVHRIGRTGRAGSQGQAYSLVSDKDVDSLSRIEDYLKHKLATGWMEDTDLIKEYQAFQTESDRYSEGGYRERRDGREGRGDHRGPRHQRHDQRPDRSDRPHRGERSGRHQERQLSDRPQGDRPHGDRPTGDRPHRQDRNRPPRPQHDGPRQERGERQDRPNRQDFKNPNRPHSPQGQNRQDRNRRDQHPHRKGQNGQRPHQAQGKHPRHAQSKGRHLPTRPQAGILQKVASFFKNLFN